MILLRSDVALKELSKLQTAGLAVAAILYVAAGTLHFVKPEAYLRIMPPYIPWHRQMVLISGISEILGGVGLLVPAIRRRAAWGLIALLIAVFPANIYMATNPIEAGAVNIPAVLRWGRLPLQLLLVWWLLWCTRTGCDLEPTGDRIKIARD
ncbi:MAG: DoxX family protein [Bryobacteraceae bacterium]